METVLYVNATLEGLGLIAKALTRLFDPHVGITSLQTPSTTSLLSHMSLEMVRSIPSLLGALVASSKTDDESQVMHVGPLKVGVHSCILDAFIGRRLCLYVSLRTSDFECL